MIVRTIQPGYSVTTGTVKGTLTRRNATCSPRSGVSVKLYKLSTSWSRSPYFVDTGGLRLVLVMFGDPTNEHYTDGILALHD